jgi:hypothetical protein
MRYTNAAWTPNIARARAVALSLLILAASVAPAVVASVAGRVRESNVALGAMLWFFVCIIPPGVLARYRSS